MDCKASHKVRFIRERKYFALLALVLFSAVSFAAQDSNEKSKEFRLSAEQTKNIEEGLQDSFSGIGTGIETHPKGIYINNVIAGGPADKAGLKGGEVITDIDGKSAIGMSLEQAVSLIKGPTGTRVNLKIFLSDGTSKDVSVVHGPVTASGVFSRIIEPNIGLLTISGFSKESAAKVKDALLNFQQQKIKGLILDIRNNKGGFLGEVEKITGMFAEPNQVMWQTQNIGQNKRISVKSDVEKMVQWPVVVLINSNTMCGGELLASALKSKGSGKLLGQKTFGEGAIYKLEKQADGTSRKIRTGNFYTADGQTIEGQGVIPDKELDLKLSPEEILKQAVYELTKEIENRK
jgi:carboxyl-terminal processing protease